MTAAILAARQRLEDRIPLAGAPVLVVLAGVLAAVAALELASSWGSATAGAEGASLARIGTSASLLAGLATAAGAAPVFFVSRISERLRNAMLAFGAGVMLAASFFSLILPGFEAAVVSTGATAVAGLTVTAGVGLGALFLYLSHELVPQRNFVAGPAGVGPEKLKRVWLFVAAITLHNFPEGLAVGVGFGEGDLARGAALALGIGLQNMPEGLVVALALAAAGYTRAKAWGVALAGGLVEPIGGAFGAGVVAFAQPLLPWALAFAAGAMLLVVARDIIPESYRHGHDLRVTAGVTGGFVVMMALDLAPL
ncbi:membrane protein [Sulfurifustis variabilis]|uniref:Membrane protein n=1 Tax=Sulfurifustis variabilis TaxID=1675686 RepID=A0A1C7AFK9_9GAMM|nr:ZIP family metal transporter [Sulfurifustis variabilis]BAU50133.1 membrane protein [Sulfurifustis variabilis]